MGTQRKTSHILKIQRNLIGRKSEKEQHQENGRHWSNENSIMKNYSSQHQQESIAADYIFDLNLLKGSNGSGKYLSLRKKLNTIILNLPNSNKGMMYTTKECSGSVGDMEKELRHLALQNIYF